MIIEELYTHPSNPLENSDTIFPYAKLAFLMVNSNKVKLGLSDSMLCGECICLSRPLYGYSILKSTLVIFYCMF